MPAPTVRSTVAALALLTAGAPTPVRGEAPNRPSGLIVGSYPRHLGSSDPDFQFHGGCAIEARDLRTRKRTVIRAPKDRDDCFRAPAVSPDGTSVLYWAEIPSRPTELRIIAMDGRAERSVAHGVSGELLASWSPDGTLIAVRARQKAVRWVIIDPSAARIWKVSPCLADPSNDDVFVWAADGRSILTVGGAAKGDPDPSRRLVKCDLDGTRGEPGPKFVGSITGIMLSPDGHSAFLLDNHQPTLATFDGEPAQRIWTDVQVDHPFWSPDGAWLGGIVRGKDNVDRVTLLSRQSHRSVQLGYTASSDLSWGPLPRRSSVDVRAIVRQVLGPGQEVTLPLTIDLR